MNKQCRLCIGVIRSLSLLMLLSVLSGAATAAATSESTAAADDTCTKLLALKFDQVEIKTAAMQRAGAVIEGARQFSMTGNGPLISGLPAFCRVIGAIHPEPGSDIRFEVWMPAVDWNGRLFGGGNGGFAGEISYSDLANAVKAGLAGTSTDTGHSGNGMQSAWAKGHPERIRDYGWRAIHLTALSAKKLVTSYYGQAAKHSYFNSCSNGGREALMEASRFPEDYDGIVAGAPVTGWTDLALSMINTVQAQMPAGSALLPEQARLLQSEVVQQCDGLDGQTDGLIADPRLCKVDVSKLACGTSSSPQCFSPPQLSALQKIYAGPHDATGQQFAFGWPPSGAEVGDPFPGLGWDGIFAGGKGLPGAHQVYPAGVLSDFFTEPFATIQTFNFDKDSQRLKSALAADLDVRPELSQFFNRGGKLIIWHGWADPTIPPQATIAFHEAALRNSGKRAKQSMRLFLIPGMQHCFGGPGPGVFGGTGAPTASDMPEHSLAAALQSWVESDRIPESVIGRTGVGGVMAIPTTGKEKERLICAYPQKSVLKVGFDPDKGSSYTCTR